MNEVTNTEKMLVILIALQLSLSLVATDIIPSLILPSDQEGVVNAAANDNLNEYNYLNADDGNDDYHDTVENKPSITNKTTENNYQKADSNSAEKYNENIDTNTDVDGDRNVSSNEEDKYENVNIKDDKNESDDDSQGINENDQNGDDVVDPIALDDHGSDQDGKAAQTTTADEKVSQNSSEVAQDPGFMSLGGGISGVGGISLGGGGISLGGIGSILGGSSLTYRKEDVSIMTFRPVTTSVQFMAVKLDTSTVATGSAAELASQLGALIGQFNPQGNLLLIFNQLLPILRGIEHHHGSKLHTGFDFAIVEIITEIEKMITLKPVREEMCVYLQNVISFFQKITLILMSPEKPALSSNDVKVQVRLMKKDIDYAMKQTVNIEPFKMKLKVEVLDLMTTTEIANTDCDCSHELNEIHEELANMHTLDVQESRTGLENIGKITVEIMEKVGKKITVEEKDTVNTEIKVIMSKCENIEGIQDPMSVLVKMQKLVSWVDCSDTVTEAKNLANVLNLHIEKLFKYGNIEYYKRYMGIIHKFHLFTWLNKILNGGEFPLQDNEGQEIILALQELVFEGLTTLKDPIDFPSFKLLMELIALRGSSASNIKDPKVKNLFMKIYTFLRDFKITAKHISVVRRKFVTVWGFLIRLSFFLNVEISTTDFWTSIGGGNYYFEQNDRIDHRSAREACQEMGGHLARPCRVDLEKLIKYAKKNSDLMNFWLDATDKKKEGFYQYSTGKELPGNGLWESGQPNNKKGIEHCVGLSKKSDDRRLDDMECESVRRYICQHGESEPDPIPQCQQVGDGCYIFIQHKRSWHDAKAECEAMESILASPCKKQLKHLLDHTKPMGGRYWIGASDFKKEGEYTYVTGTKLPCGFWNSGEPNQHGGNEDCVELFGRVPALNDLRCKTELPFICEVKDGCSGREGRTYDPEDCTKIGDSCYIIETQETRTWEEANAECKNFQSGQLASPDRQQMSMLIDHVTHLGGRYWIGATDVQSEGSYHYQDGQEMPGGYWISGEPNQCGNNEDCIEIRAAHKGLNDVCCCTKLNYICELLEKATPQEGPATPQCTNFGSSCFWINENDELTWEEANSYCKSSGGYLASPTCPSNTEALLAHMKTLGGKYWIGATDSKKEGKYMYVTGNRMIQGFWVPGEPNQGCRGEEDCIGLWSKKKGFYDENCDARLRFICQYGEVAQQVPEPKECHALGNGCFIIETSMKLTWNEAKASCENVGAKLAHPNKKQMESLLDHLKKFGDRYWIGGTDIGSEGHWTYVNGDHMPGKFWACGEPNNYKCNEHCVEIKADHKVLNDLDCDTQLAFVCQVEGNEGHNGEISSESSEHNETPCEEIGSSCFMIEPDDKLTWKSAQRYCESLGMILATPMKEDLQILLSRVARIGGRFWIGARDYESKFQLLSGSEVPCLWGPGFPEYKDDRKCVEIYAKYKALADGNCETERNFICQKL